MGNLNFQISTHHVGAQFDAFRSSTAMTNAEDTAPQFSDYPYSWGPGCGVTLDDFLKKVRARYFLTYFTIGAQRSTEAVDGRG